jgi:hypothetical protein
MKSLNIGLDIHGVIDRHTGEIVRLVRRWRYAGHRIHVITGEGWDTAGKEVLDLGVPYDKHFSIVDYHREIGTRMELKSDGWWMDRDEWDRTKGDYCLREGVDIMFDDTPRYAKWMPSSTRFVLVDDDFDVIAGPAVDSLLGWSDVLSGEEESEKLWRKQEGINPSTGKMWLTPRMARNSAMCQAKWDEELKKN